MVYNFILQSAMDHVVTLWQSKSSHLISYQNLALTVGHIGYNRQPSGWFLTVDMVPGLRVVPIGWLLAGDMVPALRGCAHWMVSGRGHGLCWCRFFLALWVKFFNLDFAD